MEQTKFALVGDLILEGYATENIDKPEWQLGALGNVIRHFQELLPGENLYYLYDFQINETIKQFTGKDYFTNNRYSLVNKNGSVPLRIYNKNKELVFKYNPSSSFLRRDKNHLKYFIKRLIKDGVKNIYIEHHFKDSFVEFFLDYIATEAKDDLDDFDLWLKETCLYIDSRYPDLIPISFYKIPFANVCFKMNQVEYKRWTTKYDPENVLEFNHRIVHTRAEKGTHLKFLANRAIPGTSQIETAYVSVPYPAFPATKVDSIGCGDSYFAYYSYFDSMGNPAKKTIEIASAAGAIAVAQKGVYLVKLDQVVRFLFKRTNKQFQLEFKNYLKDIIGENNGEHTKETI